MNTSTLPWYPPRALASCAGTTVVPFNTSAGVIATNPAASRYDAGVECAWSVGVADGLVVRLDFLEFDTECGWDFLTIYDGPSPLSPLLSRLCGTFTPSSPPRVVVSSGPAVYVEFYSDAAIEAGGVVAEFAAVGENAICDRDAACGGAGSGACKGGRCVCSEGRRGTFCEMATAGKNAFTPRQMHAAAYDSNVDILYVSGGEGAMGFLDDLYVYNFTSSSWAQQMKDVATPATTWPGARSGHTAFVWNGRFYLIGGEVASGESPNLLWGYDVAANSWTAFPTSGDAPPNRDAATYAFVAPDGKTVRPTLLTFGGVVATPGGLAVARSLYSLDIATLTWSRLPNPPAPAYAAAAAYDASSRFLLAWGGYTTSAGPPQLLAYSIDAALWYTLPATTPPATAYAAAAASGAVGGVWSVGGLAGGGDCWGGGGAARFDVRCARWRTGDGGGDATAAAASAARRAGAAAVERRGVVWVVGGSDGALLNDLVAVGDDRVAAGSGACAVAFNWCRSVYYGCDDCVARPYCKWDAAAASCEWKDAAAGLGSGTGGTGDLQQCPQVINVNLDSSIAGVVTENTTVLYRVYVDAPESANPSVLFTSNKDLYITLTQSTQTALVLTLPSIRTSRTPGLTDPHPTLLLPASDPRRYSGPYYVRVALAAPAPTPVVDFTLSVFQSPAASDPGGVWVQNDDGRTAVDLRTFVFAFLVCVTAGMALAYAVRRVRERARDRDNVDAFWRWAVGLAALSPPPPPPPQVFRAVVALPASPLDPRESAVTVCTKTEKDTTTDGAGALEMGILKSARVGEPSRRRGVPLSLALLELAGPASPAVAVQSCVVVFPGARAALARGELPPLAVGVGLRRVVE
ncbi:hypothetical protein DFJ73DRAFT_957161 [Zopfochytrium polystomum]|nr:hypothetical protein DFJ73DRAFT_957161 [Zopfochytrium polystomum]